MIDPFIAVPDADKRLFSNYIGTDPFVTVDAMRLPTSDRWHSIGTALVVHGSSTFKRGRPLGDWFTQVVKPSLF